MYTNIVW